MANITPPIYADTVGIPAQSSDTINLVLEGLITGDEPEVISRDLTFALNQGIIPPRTPVGPDVNGDLVPATYGHVAASAASGILTLSGNAVAGETVTIGSVTYTFRASVSTTANEVLVGATAADSANNLIAAINGGSGAGTLYGSATVPHPTVQARSNGSGIVGISARVAGLAGNSLASTETMTNGAFGASTLTGGLDQVGVRPIGITFYAVSTPTSGNKVGAPVYIAGCFNPALINWPASFDTDAKKYAAFNGAPSPTQIIMRAPKTGTVVLP